MGFPAATKYLIIGAGILQQPVSVELKTSCRQQ
jgi:hypothetical protein